MKKKKKILILVIVIVLILAMTGGYIYMKYQTYDYIEITKSYENNSKDNANYKKCLDGVLRYSRDGVALLSKNGEEIWNHPCQMNNPMVEMCGDSVAVGDKGGTSILVFQKKGLKGEIQTTRPIEKIAVSSQGIVSAILKDEETPMVMCYDAMGSVLVQNEVSLTTMGYPVDVALSEDGNTQIISYLCTEKNEVATKIVYYYFGDFQEEKSSQPIYETEYDNTVVPIVTYVNRNVSILVADDGIHFCQGTQKITETVRVELKQEIQSVAYGDDLIAVLVKREKTSGYRLHIYNYKGKLLTSVDVDKEYSKLQIAGAKVFLYDGRMCSIVEKNGICKFEGNLDENILELFPLSGLNKYMMINASGFHEVQLAKRRG